MITAGNLDHARAIATAAGCSFNPECDRCISSEKDGRLLGGVIFTGYTGVSIGLHCAGFDPKWVDRDLLWMAFHYPFVQLNCHKITATIPSGNLKALLFDRKLGFSEEARIKDATPDGDLIILSMRRDECRWLKRGQRGK